MNFLYIVDIAIFKSFGCTNGEKGITGKSHEKEIIVFHTITYRFPLP